jgi:citrate synthase
MRASDRLRHNSGYNNAIEEDRRLAQPIEQLIANSLGISENRVTDGLGYRTIPEWDSLSHVTLMTMLESEYGVSIDEDRMIELINVRAIRVFLAGNGAPK